MFLDIVPHDPTGHNGIPSQGEDAAAIWPFIELQKGWQMLVLWPENLDLFLLWGRKLGPYGRIVVLDTDEKVLTAIRQTKTAGQFMISISSVHHLDPAIAPTRKGALCLELYTFDGQTLDFPDDIFDVAVFPGRLKEPSPALIDEIYRVVRPGRFVVSV